MTGMRENRGATNGDTTHGTDGGMPHMESPSKTSLQLRSQQATAQTAAAMMEVRSSASHLPHLLEEQLLGLVLRWMSWAATKARKHHELPI